VNPHETKKDKVGIKREVFDLSHYEPLGKSVKLIFQPKEKVLEMLGVYRAALAS